MRAIDTSSVVYAWDNYPIGQFPSVWEWLEDEIRAMRLHISEVALDEVRNVAPDCALWLGTAGVNVLPVTGVAATNANSIKHLLGISGEAYRRGVGENDLFIIAIARQQGFELISDESVQPMLPAVKANYQIPAVCALPQVAVTCYSFLAYMKRSGQVFG